MNPDCQTARTFSGTSSGGDVEEALELTGKRMLGAVLVAGRRSDGHELAGRREPTHRLARPRRQLQAPANGLEHAPESRGVGDGFERSPLFRA